MEQNLTKLVDFEKGWNDRQDLKNSPGLSVMENAVLTDRGGVATRPGTAIFGAVDTTNGMVTSLFTAKVRGGTNIMLRASDTVLEYYNRLTSSWARLKAGFTTAQPFGFFDHSRGKVAGSIDNNFYTYFCNAVEPYQRWRNESWGNTTEGAGIVADSYSESNQSNYQSLRGDGNIVAGQVFTPTSSGTLYTCKFYLTKVGSPTGNAYAKIWSLTGAVGAKVPTGTALATSDALDISTVTGSYTLITLSFTGDNQISLTSGATYGISLTSDNGTSTDCIRMGVDSSAPTHAGNFFYSTDETAWSSTTSYDGCFYVYLRGTPAGATSLPVDSTLTDTVFYSGTAASCTTTTIDITASDWATDIWNSAFVVYITNGAQEGKVSAISDTTATQITFAAIAGLSGTPTFEIRMLKYPASGTIIDGNTYTTEAYTAITDDASLTFTSLASNHDVDVPIALVPAEYPAAPRGNILTTLFGQVFLSGSKRFPTTLYRSKIDDATDFTFSATRVAGEGDVIDIPEAVPAITDLNTFEDKLIVGGESHVEQILFTQDENDLPNRTPIISSSLVGPAGRSSKMRDDLLFANKNKEITSLSRVANQDVRPAARDIGWAIKNTTKNYDFTTARTYTFKQYSLIACKETSSSTSNDVILAYDNNRSVWVGKWNLPASCFTEYDGKLYMGSSASREVYEMFTDLRAQDKGSSGLIGYATKCKTGWLNMTKDTDHQQEFDMLCVEGYIKLNTPVTFSIYYDWQTEPTTSWIFDPASHTDNILDATAEETMGVTQMGVTPLGVELSEDSTTLVDERRFIAFFKVQATPHTYVRLGWEVDGVSKFLEMTNIAANVRPIITLKEDYIIDTETT